MNKQYRIVWSAARGAYVVADERARARGKSSSLRKAVTAALLLPAAAAWAEPSPGCFSTNNVISTPLAVNCSLMPGASVTVTSTGSIQPPIFSAIEAQNITAGTIVNEGTLSSLAHAGIEVAGSHLTGAVVNRGNITTPGAAAIAVSGNSDIDGGIRNEGTISGQSGISANGGTGSTVNIDTGLINAGSITAQLRGIVVSDTLVNGDIGNTGAITANEAGITVDFGGHVLGDVVNSGTIDGSDDDFGAAGIRINTQDANKGVQGSVWNQTGGTIRSDLGIEVINESAVGAIRNDGVIDSAQVGLIVDSTATVRDGLINSGTIGGGMLAVYSMGDMTIKIVGDHARFLGDVLALGDVVVSQGAVFTNDNAFMTNRFIVEQGATFNLTEGPSTYAPVVYSSTPGGGGITVMSGFSNAGTTAVAAGVTGAIHGNYQQTDSGTLRIGVAGDTSYGKLVVDGTASLPSNANIYVDVKTPAGYTFSVDRLQGVLSATTLESDGTFVVRDNSRLFAFEAVKNENSIDLKMKKEAALQASVTAVGNNPAVGAAAALDRILDSNPDSPLNAYFTGLSTDDEISNAVTQTLPLMTGASTTAAASGALSSINRVVQARMDSNAGLSSGEGFLTDQHLWLKPFGSWADQDNRGGVAGYNADTMGFAIGSDATLNEKARVGVAFAYAKADVDGASNIAPQSMEVDVYQLIGYGSYSLGSNTELNVQVDIGQNENSGKRGIGFANLTAKSDYNSFSTHVGAGIGHTLGLNDGITFTPSARLDYTTIRDEGYSEKGADALNLRVSSHRAEELIASVDGKFNLKVTDNTTVALNVGAGYDVTNDRASINAAFAGEPGFGFTTYGIEQNRWMLRSGIGLTHTASNGTEVTARYDNEGRSGFSNQTASLKVRWAF